MALCAFCRVDGPLTDEHVFGDWMTRHVPVTQDGYRSRRQWVNDAGGLAYDWYDVPRPPATAVVKVVCGRCNNGWMSSLEAQAGRLLTPMARGERVTLDPAAIATLAAWASKTAMMREYLNPRAPAYSQRQRSWLRTWGTPPPWTRIVIGTLDDLDDLFSRHLVGMTLSVVGDNAEHALAATTIAFGSVILQIVCTTMEEGQQFLRDLPFKGAPVRGDVVDLWPRRDVLEWPLRRRVPLDAVGPFSELVAHWLGLYGAPPPPPPGL